MIQSVTVTNHKNESLKIELMNYQSSGLIIGGIEGLGPGQVDVNIAELSTADGGIYSSSRAPSREIVLTLYLTDDPTIEDSRHKVYRYFPIKKFVTLEIETDRRISTISGIVSGIEPDIFSEHEAVQVTVNCPDPWFYSVGDDKTTFSGVVPRFEFPFPPFEFAPIENAKPAAVGVLAQPMSRMMARAAAARDGGMLEILYPADGSVIPNLTFSCVYRVFGSEDLQGTEIIKVDGVQINGTSEYSVVEGGWEGARVLSFNTVAAHYIEIEVDGTTARTDFSIDLGGADSSKPTVIIETPDDGDKPLRPVFDLYAKAYPSMNVDVTTVNVWIDDQGPIVLEVGKASVSNQFGTFETLELRNVSTVDGAFVTYQDHVDIKARITAGGNGNHKISVQAINSKEVESDIVTSNIECGGDWNEFGEIMVDTSVSFFYSGDIDTGILFRIHVLSNIHKLVLFNTDDHTQMTIDCDRIGLIAGVPVGVGDDILISTVSGSKYARLQKEGELYNILATVDRSSDWMTLKPGYNSFDFSADDGEGNVMIGMYYQTVYGGI